ncbi:hypothetical protein BCR44DRAFT_1427877, partial [Catenaria anguillulae PL171]
MTVAKARSRRNVQAWHHYPGRYTANVEDWRSRSVVLTRAKVARGGKLGRQLRNLRRNNTNHVAGRLEFLYAYCNGTRTAPLFPIGALEPANTAFEFEDVFGTRHPFSSRTKTAEMAKVIVGALKSHVAASDWPIIRGLLLGFHCGACINDGTGNSSHRDEFWGCWREYVTAASYVGVV